MADDRTPASEKPQTLLERYIGRYGPSDSPATSHVYEGAIFGAREVLSAPVSDAVLKAYYDARTVPGCDECEQRERAGVAQGLRPCERHRIAAALKAIAAEMGVTL